MERAVALGSRVYRYFSHTQREKGTERQTREEEENETASTKPVLRNLGG